MLNPGFELTGFAAIALPAIAVRANEEETTAIVGFTRPLTESFFGGDGSTGISHIRRKTSVKLSRAVAQVLPEYLHLAMDLDIIST